MSENRAEAPPAGRVGRGWYVRPWVMLVAGYVFPPLGLFLMWRYRNWPRWVKATVTLVGSAVAAVSTYVSSTYIWPRIF